MRNQLLSLGSLASALFIVGCGSGLDTSSTTPLTVAATSTPVPSKILFSVAATNGNMSGVAGADALCAASLPAGVTTAKALIVDGTTRVACTTANCSGGAAEHTDWVLAANTQYKLASGTSIGTTNSVGIFTFPLDNIINASVVQTGLTSVGGAWTTGATCSAWSTTAGSESCGFTTVTSASSILDPNAGGGCTCNAARSVICVQM